MVDTATLDREGWLPVTVLAPAAAEQIGRRCLEVLAALGDDRRPGDKPSQGTLHLVDLAERVPAVAAAVDHPELRAGVAHLLGPGPERGEVSFRCPTPGHGGQYLHADWVPLERVGPAVVATAIVALCEFTPDNGATRLVPGSHLRPDQQRRSGSLDRHPDELVLTGPAGTAFLFSGHVLHSGTPNRSGAPRPALQVVWRRRGVGGVDGVSAATDPSSR